MKLGDTRVCIFRTMGLRSNGYSFCLSQKWAFILVGHFDDIFRTIEVLE